MLLSRRWVLDVTLDETLTVTQWCHTGVSVDEHTIVTVVISLLPARIPADKQWLMCLVILWKAGMAMMSIMTHTSNPRKSHQSETEAITAARHQ